MVFEVVAMPEIDVPEVAFPFIVFSMCAVGLLVLSVQYWAQGTMRWMSGQAVFPTPEPRQLQRWGVVDLVFAFLVVVGLQMFAAYSGVLLHIGTRPAPDGELGLSLITWISAIQTFAAFIVTAFIARRCGVKASSIGWSLSRITHDIRLGLKAFIVLAPPIYFLMSVVHWLSGQEYKHPIHEMASQDPWMLLPALFLAVILAPLGEEFAFRVLLQGFLESLSIGRFNVEKFFIGRVDDTDSQTLYESKNIQAAPEVIVSSNLSSAEWSNPYATSTTVLDGHEIPSFDPSYSEHPSVPLAVDISSEVAVETSLPWWPMFVSGLIFGLAHFEYGMSWIPLTVLGIALGWLYRITNRIWPSLVVHFCVNALSMIGFSLSVLFGEPHV